MKKIFRKPFRYILSILTKAVIAKHKPTVIAVMGDGQTSIAREIIYEVIATTYPARRNLESPESEFSVPLTILGYPKYPKTLLDWLKMIGKTTVQFFKVKPYHHFLVLELNSIDLNILKYWLDITTSDVALIVGNTPINYSNYNFKKIIKVSAKDLDDILGPFKIAARQIAKFYNIKSELTESTLNNFSLPLSKIRFLPGQDGSFIIDATHYYIPTKLESVLELAEAPESGSKVIFTTLEADKKIIKSIPEEKWQVNPQNYIPRNNDIIILRGDRVKQNQKFYYLINSKIPLI